MTAPVPATSIVNSLPPINVNVPVALKPDLVAALMPKVPSRRAC